MVPPVRDPVSKKGFLIGENIMSGRHLDQVPEGQRQAYRAWDEITYAIADIASFDDKLPFRDGMEAVRDMDIDQAMAYVCQRLLSIDSSAASRPVLRLVDSPEAQNTKGDME